MFIDGIQIAGHTIVVTLRVDATGHKHTLGLWEGTTENAAVCGALLGNLIARGLPTDGALLFVIDGGKGIRKAIADSYGSLALVHQREKWFRRINSYRDLWLLGRALDRHTKEVTSSTTAA